MLRIEAAITRYLGHLGKKIADKAGKQPRWTARYTKHKPNPCEIDAPQFLFPCNFWRHALRARCLKEQAQVLHLRTTQREDLPVPSTASPPRDASACHEVSQRDGRLMRPKAHQSTSMSAVTRLRWKLCSAWRSNLSLILPCRRGCQCSRRLVFAGFDIVGGRRKKEIGRVAGIKCVDEFPALPKKDLLIDSSLFRCLTPLDAQRTGSR